MNTTKRASRYLLRNRKKTALIFFLVFVLAVIGSGAFSIHQAVHHTKERLFTTIPAFASISFRPEQHQQFELNFPIEQIRKISELSYVANYAYYLDHTFYSTELRRYINSRPDESWGVRPEDITDIEGIQQNIEDGYIENFHVRGVSTRNVYLEAGIIRMIEGRDFEESELQQGLPVAVISDGFARINNLEVGSTFELDNIFFDGGHFFESAGTIMSFDDFMNSAVVNQKTEVTVIGIFEVLRFMDSDNLWQNIQFTQNALNRIYVPLRFVEDSRNFLLEQGSTLYRGVGATFFVNDPRDLSDFLNVANTEILSDVGWTLVDLSENLEAVLPVLEMMEWLASTVLYGVFIAAAIILALLISLSVRDRRSEIGLYLALGERKINIAKQLFSEVLVTTILAMSLGLFTGNLLSGTLADTMLQSELLAHETEEPFLRFFPPMELMWFDTGEVALEEVAETFDFSLSPQEITIFYSIGIVSVLLGATLPITTIIRLNPKEIIM